MVTRAVFLDRDGVLVEDKGPLPPSSKLCVLEGVPRALYDLSVAGFRLFVVTNQTVVARGVATEDQVVAVHQQLAEELVRLGGAAPERFYFCPHHPEATLAAYRTDCDCRKPKPGLLRQAAWEHDIDLAGSFLVGDRLSDIQAGAKAGCATILVETGMHEMPPIISAAYEAGIEPDYVCADLPEAAAIILGTK